MIGLLVKLGADKIAAAQREGELVRGLIADLTTAKENARQDIALLALNHSVPEERRHLVLDIAERLVLDTLVYVARGRAAADSSCPAVGSVAMKILAQRDAGRARAVRDVLVTRDPACAQQREASLAQDYVLGASASAQVRAALRSDADPAQPASAAVDSQAEAVSRLIAPITSGVAFVQFRGSVQRATIDSLRVGLARAGFVAPGVERVNREFTSGVRYFHAEDRLLADSAAILSKRFIESRLPSALPIPVQDLSRRGFRVPRGQIEVWISVR